MKLQTRLLISAFSLAALPLAQAGDFDDYGRVVNVQPRTEQVRVPRQECRTQYVQTPVQQQRGSGGTVIGGIAGALLGSQVGGGNGKVAAAAAGAIAGAMVGDHVENDGRPVDGGVQEQAVRQCRNVEEIQTRNAGYNVTYEYRGHTYTQLMNRDPGDRVRLHVSVVADAY